MRQCYLQGWGRDSGKATKVKAKYEGMALLNPRALAVSTLCGWGKVQDSHVVESQYGYGLWVSTPGHGGYVLVTTQRLPFRACLACEFQLPEGPEVFVYEFEEDCEWSNLLHNDPVAFESDWKRRQSWSKGTREEYAKSVEDCYDRWCRPKETPSSYVAADNMGPVD